MTTMLERAARAIHASDQARDPIVPDWEWVSQDAYISMARAVLLAVREPDDESIRSAFFQENRVPSATWHLTGESRKNSYAVYRAENSLRFTAMIDTILNEGTTHDR